MKATIVTIGDEILIGQIVDTNSSYIAKALDKIGIATHEMLSISDDKEHILNTFKMLQNEVEVVIITGGLGPTKDDITKKTFCNYFEDTLVENESVLLHVKEIIEGFYKRPITQINREQALVPTKAKVLFNKVGTAPGMWMEKENTVFISLPGVPYEMKYLVDNEVIPNLVQKFERPYIVHQTIMTYGRGESLIAEQIEVIRGPATVLYGAGAVGGVVNVIDHRIPKESLDGLIGRAETRFGGADNERSGAAVADVGNGLFAIHADFYTRKTDDLEIPGSAIRRIKANNHGDHVSNGKLVNSAAKSDGGAIGASLTFDQGHVGVSYSESNSNYGTVAEPTVKVDMLSKRWDLSSEVHGLDSFIQRMKFRMAYTDYQHQEIDAGVVGTTFLNKGVETTLEAGHAKIGEVSGVFGLQTQNTRFEALGDEAFVPSTHTASQGLYFYEELPIFIFIC